MENSLSNLKILDFSTLLPGPYATLMLADMGAEVLKIASKSKYDLVLESGYRAENGKTANLMWLGRNKKSMSLNLKTPEAIEIIKKLILEYDILVEQFRPGVMEKLGLSYETLKEINPKLIYVSISSYGQTGPMKNRAGHDINFLSLSGIMNSSGRKSTGPSLINTQIGDLAGGALHGIIGLLAAVNYRNVTGVGQHVDISMLDALIPLNTLNGINYLSTSEEPKREEEIFNGGNIYDFYQTSDDKYMSVASLEPKFLNSFCEILNLPDLLKEGAFTQNTEIKNNLKSIFKTKTQAEWIEIFSKYDCCVEPVLSYEEAFTSPQVVAREMIVELKDGDKSYRQFANPIKFSVSKNRYDHVGYEIGKDNLNVLKNLGYSEKEIEELANKDVFK